MRRTLLGCLLVVLCLGLAYEVWAFAANDRPAAGSRPPAGTRQPVPYVP
jgi:hypothetical protein